MAIVNHIKEFGIRRQAARKWRNDVLSLPLTPAHRDIYERIHVAYFKKFNRFPDLVDGSEFNEAIQWLKLFDQNPLAIQCSDKLGVREFVAERVGTKYLLDVYQAGQKFSDIDFDALPRSFVLKTNSDSGTVILVRDKANIDLVAVEEKITRSLNRKPYGWRTGEWGYRYIPRRVFAEQMINPEREGAPPDYKLHCSEGRVKFVQYLYDRSVSLREQIISVEAVPTSLRLAGHRAPGDAFVKPAEWDELLWVAEKLSADFKYVRVDLYVWNGRIYAGELTFWPHSGLYEGAGQVAIGKFLDFDRTTHRQPFEVPV